MTEVSPARSGMQGSLDADALELLATMSGEAAERVRQLLHERESLFVLQEALIAAERTEALVSRLRIFVEAIAKIGFDRVVITLRDDALDPTLVVSSGLSNSGERDLRQRPSDGATWRRRLPLLERFRISNSYYLDGHDPWIREEFHGGSPNAIPVSDDPTWSPLDTLLVPLRAADGKLLATLALDDPDERRRPSLARIRIVELFGQQVANQIEQTMLTEVAHRRAERLQRIQEVGTALARSLDERAILQHLAKQLPRVLPADGVLIAAPDLEHAVIATTLRLVHGVDRPVPVVALGAGVIAQVARLGRSVCIDDYQADLAVRGVDDVVHDAGPAGSVLAVPMIVGIQLIGVIAVHSTTRHAYSGEDEEMLMTIAAQAATAIVNARLFQESESDRRQSEALAEVARAVSESLRLGEVLNLILRHALALLRAEGAVVALREDDYLNIVAAVGTAETVQGMHLPLNGSEMGHVVREGRHRIINDAENDPGAYRVTQRIAGIRRAVLVPLITAQGAVGSIGVSNRASEFTEEDARILQRLADQVAVAIVNARLFEEVASATREWSVAFDAIASGLAVLDLDGRIVRCNARAVQLVGATSARDLHGRDFHETLLGEPCNMLGECVLQRAIEGGPAGRDTFRSDRWGRVFDVVASPHPSGGAVVAFDDVTVHHALGERHRAIIETAKDAIVITDTRRHITLANPAAHTLLGRGAELVGMAANDTVAPEKRAETAAHAERTLAGEAQEYETIIIRPDGEHRIVSLSSAPLREVGQITGAVVTMRDVTEERRTRDAVAASEARYRELFETASDAIYTLDAKGSFTSANDALCQLLGLPRDELVAHSIEPFLAPEELSEVRTLFTHALSGEPQHYECHVVREGGQRRLMSVTNSPIRFGDRVVGVLGIARDVTEERARQEALERSEARYTRLVESASDAIFTVDEEGNFTSMNRALEDATGRDRVSLIGTNVTGIIEQRDRASVWQMLVKTLDRQRQRAEIRYLDGGGAIRFGSVITAPIIEQDRVTGVLAVMRDTTDEKRLLEQALQQEKLAAIGQLVSGVAHELNNPLAGVMAFSQLLMAAPLVNEESHQAAQTIHEEAKRAAKIVSNLLTFARQHQPQRADTDLNRVLTDTLELRRYALRVQQVDVSLDLDEDLPVTWADPFQLQQVLLNLITNAEQALASWAGPRTLRITTARARDRLAVTITDSGPGIAPENVDRIFNPFYTTKPVGEGTGLGLSISDGIVREHGGRIRVESQPGQGATFIIELPFVEPPSPTKGKHAPIPYRSMRPNTILVVDDEAAIRTAVSSFLTNAGHIVDTAASGRDALALLDVHRYDAILLDLRMPDMGGDRIFTELKRRAPDQASRVVFITGDVQSDSAHAFLRSTGRPFLHKPFLLDELTGVLFADQSA